MLRAILGSLAALSLLALGSAPAETYGSPIGPDDLQAAPATCTSTNATSARGGVIRAIFITSAGPVNAEQAIRELARHGARPATCSELAAYIEGPGRSETAPVIALDLSQSPSLLWETGPERVAILWPGGVIKTISGRGTWGEDAVFMGIILDQA